MSKACQGGAHESWVSLRPTAVAAEVPAEKLQQCQLALMQQLACQHPASREETTSRYSTATEQYMYPGSQTLTLKRSDCVPLAGTVLVTETGRRQDDMPGRQQTYNCWRALLQ